MLEDGVTKTVTNDVGRSAARGPGCGRPELPGLVIANIKQLASDVLDGVVVPRSQPEFMRVLEPGVSAAPLRNDRPKRRIRQHINPRSRGVLAGLKSDDVLLAIAGK